MLKSQNEGIIKLIKVDEIIPIAAKPKLDISHTDKGMSEDNKRIVEFTTSVEEKDNIELYQWDLNYDEEKGFKAEIMLDKEGKCTHTFTAGTYHIACKVVDVDGLSAMRVIKLIINGVVKQEG